MEIHDNEIIKQKGILVERDKVQQFERCFFFSAVTASSNRGMWSGEREINTLDTNATYITIFFC